MTKKVSLFYVHWLTVVGALFVVFGLCLVLLPSFTKTVFGLILYGDVDQLHQLGAHADRYLSLIHAVLGAVLVGWGALIIGVTKTLVALGHSAGWQILLVSLLAWFVPDTAYSLLSGFWQNALFNLAFAVPLAIGIVGVRPKR
jgi:hypothetical protein